LKKQPEGAAFLSDSEWVCPTVNIFEGERFFLLARKIEESALIEFLF
jgi:hypothetical protein